MNRRVRGEEQERQQHVGQCFGCARRESVSAEYQQKREPSFRGADVGGCPREYRCCERCACDDGHCARANLVDGAAGRIRDDCRQPIKQRRFAIGIAVCVARYQPMAVAHDALNPLGRLRLRVLLKRRADSLHENYESEDRRDRECRGPKNRTTRGDIVGHRSHRRRVFPIGSSHRWFNPLTGS